VCDMYHTSWCDARNKDTIETVGPLPKLASSEAQQRKGEEGGGWGGDD
jgi:hypothetical protein